MTVKPPQYQQWLLKIHRPILLGRPYAWDITPFPPSASRSIVSNFLQLPSPPPPHQETECGDVLNQMITDIVHDGVRRMFTQRETYLVQLDVEIDFFDKGHPERDRPHVLMLKERTIVSGKKGSRDSGAITDLQPGITYWSSDVEGILQIPMFVTMFPMLERMSV